MATNSTVLEALEFDDHAERRGARASTLNLGDTRTKVGIVLIVAGVGLLLFTWGQVRSLENMAAQIPYVVSGGLPGVGLMALGGLALFSTPAAPDHSAAVEALGARLDQLARTADWTADAIEQIAAHLNEQAGDRAEREANGNGRGAAASGRARAGR